jgi:hypothetical protein
MALERLDDYRKFAWVQILEDGMVILRYYYILKYRTQIKIFKNVFLVSSGKNDSANYNTATCFLLTRRIIVGCGSCISINWVYTKRNYSYNTSNLISHKPVTS